MQIFAFEVIPNFVTKTVGPAGGTIYPPPPPPRILKWELTKRPRGDKLDSIFIERVSIIELNIYNY
jgi:hypothetical protein